MVQLQRGIDGCVIQAPQKILLLLTHFVALLSEIHHLKMSQSKNELQLVKLQAVMHDKNLSDEDMRIITLVELTRG